MLTNCNRPAMYVCSGHGMICNHRDHPQCRTLPGDQLCVCCWVKFTKGLTEFGMKIPFIGGLETLTVFSLINCSSSLKSWKFVQILSLCRKDSHMIVMASSCGVILAFVGHTDLHIIWNVPSHQSDKILQHIFMHNIAAVENLFMDNNTSLHRDKLVDMLDDEGTEHGDWSSCSPDLNPVELLQYAYRCIAAHPSPRMVVQQVEKAFLYKNCVELTKICCIIWFFYC